MKKQEVISCLHTPAGGVEGKTTNNSVSKQTENSVLTENTVNKVFNMMIDDELNTPDMNKTINFEDFLHASMTMTPDFEVMDTWNCADFDFDLPDPQASTVDHLSELVLPDVPVECTYSPIEHTSVISEFLHIPTEYTHTNTELAQTPTELTNNTLTTTEIAQTPTELTLTTIEHENDTTEHVWAFETFEDSSVGLCLPAVEAEGGRMELPVTGEDTGTKDLLTWILEDTQIGDWNVPQEISETTQHFVIERLEEEEDEEKDVGKIEKVKMESLTQDEKYRRMREQNNRASQACRAKRKRKLVEEEEEMKRLEERNKVLVDTMRRMEAEVTQMKKMILEQVAVGGNQ